MAGHVPCLVPEAKMPRKMREKDERVHSTSKPSAAIMANCLHSEYFSSKVFQPREDKLLPFSCWVNQDLLPFNQSVNTKKLAYNIIYSFCYGTENGSCLPTAGTRVQCEYDNDNG